MFEIYTFTLFKNRTKIYIFSKLGSKFTLVQEAMESPAFPHMIEIKLMKLKMYKLINIFMSPKNMQKAQKALCLCTGNMRKIPFFILIIAKRGTH